MYIRFKYVESEMERLIKSCVLHDVRISAGWDGAKKEFYIKSKDPKLADDNIRFMIMTDRF